MSRTVRYILAALCLAGAAFFLLPLAAGILHFGMVWPAAVLLLAAAVLLRPDFFRRLLRPVWLRRLVGCVAAVCMTVILVTLGKMASAALHRPADGQDCTVVVLGCQVFPDGHPSLMLRGRINAAYDYLSAHPDAVCVASGGMDDSEPITEAQCIRDTLVSMASTPDASTWRIVPAPRRKIWPFPRSLSAPTACPPMWPSPRTISTSCAAPSGRSAAA